MLNKMATVNANVKRKFESDGYYCGCYKSSVTSRWMTETA